MSREPQRVLSHAPEVVDRMICDSVRIKAEVVSGDEKEQDRRRILNFGHTFGHALEAETGYSRFLHGEAVAWGMKAATLLGEMEHMLSASRTSGRFCDCVNSYGPLPPLNGHRSGADGGAAQERQEDRARARSISCCRSASAR